VLVAVWMSEIECHSDGSEVLQEIKPHSGGGGVFVGNQTSILMAVKCLSEIEPHSYGGEVSVGN
jgi:hypothetical protein